MDRFTRRAEDDQGDMPANEMRVSAQGKIGNYLIYANALIESQGYVTVKATGSALTKAITVAELMKRRHPGLHQITDVETVQFVDEYNKTEGESRVEKRWKAAISLQLSKTPLDSSHVGYQAPSTEVPAFRPSSRRAPAIDDRDFQDRRSRAPRDDAAHYDRPYSARPPRPDFNQEDRRDDRRAFAGERRDDRRGFVDERRDDRRGFAGEERRGYPERRAPFGGDREQPHERPNSAFGDRRPFVERREDQQWQAAGPRGERGYGRPPAERSYGDNAGRRHADSGEFRGPPRFVSRKRD